MSSVWIIQTINVHAVCYAGGFAAAPVANDAPPAANEPENLQAANPWAMLLRTFLPWINAGQAPDYNQQQEDGRDDSHNSVAGAAGAGNEVVGETHGADASGDEEDDLD